MPVTNFIWDELSDNVRMEVDETGAVTAEYMNEPSQFGNLLSQRRASVNNFYHFDVQSSARQVTANDQSVSDSYAYSAFGEPVTSTGSTANPFRYNGATGYYSDDETGELYVRRRTYNTDLARWLSTDPIIFEDSNNLFAYVSNQPINLSDPSGRQVSKTYAWMRAGEGIVVLHLTVTGSTTSDCRVVEPPEDCIDPKCEDRCKGEVSPTISFIATREPTPGDPWEFKLGENYYLIACGKQVPLKLGRNFTGSLTLSASVDTCKASCCDEDVVRNAYIAIPEKLHGSGKPWVSIVYSFLVSECGLISNETITASLGTGDTGGHIMEPVGK